MGRLLVLTSIFCAIAGLFYPWIGVLYGYMDAILEPQDIWFWAFHGMRAEFWVLFPTCVGAVVWMLRGKCSFKILQARRNTYLFLLWILLILSYFLGPFTHVGGPYRFDNATTMLWRVNKMMLFYFVACLCIDTERKTKFLYFVVFGSIAYLAFWANHQYWTGHYFGRLTGPESPTGYGLYTDQNAFAMLFVVAQPFFWHFGALVKNKWGKWLSWGFMLLSWNAIFLTGSRGGFLGLAVVLLLLVARSQKKFIGLLLLPLFSFAVIYHGGSVFKRRILTINHYQQNASAEERLEAWRAALRMAEAHPVFGVGLASFGPAFPHFSTEHPRETHDTVLQITAESGVPAGMTYVAIAAMLIFALWKNGARLKQDIKEESSKVLLAINEATLIGFCGYLTCGIFLSLQYYEIYYCLNVLANSVIYLSSRRFQGRNYSLTYSPVEG